MVKVDCKRCGKMYEWDYGGNPWHCDRCADVLTFRFLLVCCAAVSALFLIVRSLL